MIDIKAIRGADPQHVFAAEVGTTQATVSRWERGISRPEQDFIPKLIAAAKRRGHKLKIDDFFSARG